MDIDGLDTREILKRCLNSSRLESCQVACVFPSKENGHNNKMEIRYDMKFRENVWILSAPYITISLIAIAIMFICIFASRGCASACNQSESSTMQLRACTGIEATASVRLKSSETRKPDEE